MEEQAILAGVRGTGEIREHKALGSVLPEARGYFEPADGNGRDMMAELMLGSGDPVMFEGRVIGMTGAARNDRYEVILTRLDPLTGRVEVTATGEPYSRR